MSYMSKFIAAVVGLIVMTVLASRHLFLFTVFRDPPGSFGSQAGSYHLWLALSAGIAACIAGATVFYLFFRQQRLEWPKVSGAPIEILLTAISDTPTNNSVSPPFDSVRYGRLSPWLSEGQADDRTPMNGAVKVNDTSSLSAQRAIARRTHQIMFKKWSQARHY